MTPHLIEEFANIVGRDNIITDPAQMAGYLGDYAALARARTPLVVRPASTAEVAQIMRLATRERIAIVPQGGNTGLVGGQIPDESGTQLLLSLSRLNRIRSIDIQAAQVVVEAGVVLKTLQQEVERAGRFFPLSLGAEGSCQIGGNLSSNAGGTAVLAYGNARDLCLGLEVVLPDGRILGDLRRVKKDNSGYDLKNLFIGAEGTLGIITAAVLKLFPMLRGRAVAYVALPAPEQALELFAQAQERAGPMLTGFELVGQVAMGMTLNLNTAIRPPFDQAHDWYALIELSSAYSEAQARQMIEEILTHAFETRLINDAVIAANRGQERDFWQLREDMAPAQVKLGLPIRHDVSVPLHAMPDFIQAADALTKAAVPAARIACFGHMGDGNLHYDVVQPVDLDAATFLQQWGDTSHEIHALAMRYHGSFSAEHGIGQLKRRDLATLKSPIALELMRGIKQVFDPLGIMNPGKIL